MADGDSLLRRRRQAHRDVSRARVQLYVQLGVGSVWTVLAVLRSLGSATAGDGGRVAAELDIRR